MMQVPFVSVIIPAYNASRTLGRTLDRVFSQTYPKDRFEVIVVDDCSSDDTRRVASRYPLAVIRHDINLGSGAARNSGVQKAKGEILVFTDADDEVDERWLSCLVGAFESGANIGCVTGSTWIRFEGGNFQERIVGEHSLIARGGEKITRKDAYDKRGSIAKGKSVGPNISFRRGAFERVGGYDPALHTKDGAGEEYDLVWRIEDAGYRVKFEENAIVYKHEHRKDSFGKYLKHAYLGGNKSTVFLSKHLSRLTLHDILTALYVPLSGIILVATLILRSSLPFYLLAAVVLSPLGYYLLRSVKGRRFLRRKTDIFAVVALGFLSFVSGAFGTMLGWLALSASTVLGKLKRWQEGD